MCSLVFYSSSPGSDLLPELLSTCVISPPPGPPGPPQHRHAPSAPARVQPACCSCPSSPCTSDVSNLGGAPPWGWLLFVVLKQRLCFFFFTPFYSRFSVFPPSRGPTCVFDPSGRVDVEHAVCSDGLVVVFTGRSGMDSLGCPILLAALAVSLFSSPAIADRKFGKNLSLFLSSYWRIFIFSRPAPPFTSFTRPPNWLVFSWGGLGRSHFYKS